MLDTLFKKQLLVWIIIPLFVIIHLTISYFYYEQIKNSLGLDLFIDVYMIGVFAPILLGILLCLKFEAEPTIKNNTIYFFAQPIKYGVEGS